MKLKFFDGLLMVMLAVALICAGASITRVSAQTPNLRDPISCDQQVVVSGASAATTQLVALTANQRVRVCGFVFTGAGTTTAKLVSGTGSNCASGPSDLTAALALGANTSVAYGGGAGVVVKAALSEALCWTNGQAVQVSGVVTYAKF